MNKNGNFKSTVGFVLACVGSAVEWETYGCFHIV